MMKKSNKIYNQFVKRFLDIILSILLLIMLSPAYTILILILYLFQGSPIIFEQIRIGLHGKKFKIYKFRTMKIDAEELKNKFTEEEKKEYEEN